MFGVGALDNGGADPAEVLASQASGAAARPYAGAATGPSAKACGTIAVAATTAGGAADEEPPAELLDPRCVVLFLWPGVDSTFTYAVSHPHFCRVPDAVLDAVEALGPEASTSTAPLVAMCLEACVLGASERVSVAAVVADAAHKAGILGKYGS